MISATHTAIPVVSPAPDRHRAGPDPAAAVDPRDSVVRRRQASRREDRSRLRVCAWLALLFSVGGQAQELTDPEGLLVRTKGGDWRETVALETAVDFRIRGLLAEVSVRQRYINDSGEWLEGRYLLPLPGDAAVGRLSLHVGDRVIEGEIREKAEAQAMYEAAAAQGQTASLVEQSRPNLFSTAVANIGPGEAIEIEIGYWQAVTFQDGAFSVALPLTLTPQYHPIAGDEKLAALDRPVGTPPAAAASTDIGEAFEPTVTIDVDLDAGLPLASVTSVTHAIEVEPAERGYRIRLANQVEPSDRDFELRWAPRASDMPQQAVFSETIDGENYVLLMLVPPTVPVEPVPRELVLVVDNSGSMAGESMTQAIAALDRALSRLRPSDRFNIIRFDDTIERVFAQAVPADADNVTHARHFVQSLQANGGTELLPALQLAFSTPPTPGYLRQIVLLTDAGVGNEQELLQAIESQRGDARLFAVGIGSAPNEHFLRRAVELGRGSQVLVRDTAEVDTRTDSLLAKLDQPALRDLDLRWPVAAEAYPALLPDLYVGEPLQVVAKLSSLGGELKAEGQGRHRPWQERVALMTAQNADGRGVARLWARAKITALDDQLRQGVAEDTVRAQTLDIALKHGLVSRYTSLVAVDKTPVRPGDADLASAGFANATPDGSLAYANGATSARTQLMLAVVLAFFAALVLGRRRGAERPPGANRRQGFE